MKILFICRGNVGRSQMAEALFKKYAKGKADAISAGIKLSGPEQPIKKLLPEVQEVFDVMKEEGLDISSKIRKQLTEKMVLSSDKVVVMIEEQEAPLPEYLINSPKLIRWSIPDPQNKDLIFTRQTKDRIRSLIQDLIKNLS